MEKEKEVKVEEEIQTTFNKDGIEILCEDAVVENENKEEVE